MQRRKLTVGGGIQTLGALVALLLLLSSCIKYEGVIKIEDDGSGSVDILTAVDPEAFGALGDLADLGDAGDLGGDEICSSFSSELNSPGDLPAGANVQPYNEDGFCGARVQYTLAASTDHSAALADVFDDSTRIYKQGDNWFFESNFNADEVTGEASAFGGDDIVGDLFADASFKITIDLPGRAVPSENNATNVGDDGRFTWDIDLLNPPARLFAQTEPGSGGGTGGGGGGGISPILIGVILAALLGGAGFFLYKKKNEADAGAGASLDAQPGAGTMMPQPSATPGAAATMPVGDGPSIIASPPNPADVKETVVMSAADIALSASIGDSAAASSTPQPVYDDALGAWVVDDPARGRLRHDPATDTWNPIQ